MNICPICPQSLSFESLSKIHLACGPCQRHLKQMLAGYNGVTIESKPVKTTWNNTAGYEEWVGQLEATDADTVNLRKKDEYVEQRCDIRDMKREVGLPEFLPLEKQVFMAWINTGVKDEKIQEVLGLNYSQLFHVKNVIRMRLQKQMNYYHSIKKAKENYNG